jgi:hypothetical protein
VGNGEGEEEGTKIIGWGPCHFHPQSQRSSYFPCGGDEDIDP